MHMSSSVGHKILYVFRSCCDLTQMLKNLSDDVILNAIGYSRDCLRDVITKEVYASQTKIV